ncbi:MAG: transketolase family protein [Oscillospiraceae bacterium]|nr:transketolase family protein [Oscillospiraceae bacterium]
MIKYTPNPTIEIDRGEMRKVFAAGLAEMAKTDDRIYLMDSDLMASMSTRSFMDAFPDRTINCGIQEANMMGVAAGLSAMGKIPFTHTFGAFAARRAYDQIFISCAYSQQNVKIIGSDPGVTAAGNGGTHMPFEDVALMRAIPNMTIVEPTDITMLASLLPQIKDAPGCTYIRLCRKVSEAVYPEGSQFKLGEAALLREGKDVAIIASGYCVHQALIAAQDLAAEGISATVIDMFTIAPLDREAVLAAAECGAVVVAENHNVNGGLGSAVAEALGEMKPTPLVRVGIKDSFGEVGTREQLAARFGIDAAGIVAGVKRAMKN